MAHPASGFAVVGVAARIKRSGGRITHGAHRRHGHGAARLPRAPGGSNCWRAARTSRQAVGTIGEGEEANSDLYADADYRRHLARVYAARAVAVALIEGVVKIAGRTRR